MLLGLKFGVSLTFEIYNKKQDFWLKVKLDGESLDILGCPKGKCKVQVFLEFIDKMLEG